MIARKIIGWFLIASPIIIIISFCIRDYMKDLDMSFWEATFIMLRVLLIILAMSALVLAGTMLIHTEL